MKKIRLPLVGQKVFIKIGKYYKQTEVINIKKKYLTLSGENKDYNIYPDSDGKRYIDDNFSNNCWYFEDEIPLKKEVNKNDIVHVFINNTDGVEYGTILNVNDNDFNVITTQGEILNYDIRTLQRTIDDKSLSKINIAGDTLSNYHLQLDDENHYEFRIKAEKQQIINSILSAAWDKKLNDVPIEKLRDFKKLF